MTICAAAVGGAAKARQRRDRTVNDPQNLTKGNLIGGPQQRITARSPTTALHQPLTLEVEEDLFQELVRNTVLPRDLADHGGGLDARERKQGLERVLCPLRDHDFDPGVVYSIRSLGIF